MTKWIVKASVNRNICGNWEFEDKKESLEFWKKKVQNIAKERIAYNDQAQEKFKDESEFAYIWYDVENKWEGLRKSKKWREVKEEREKNEK